MTEFTETNPAAATGPQQREPEQDDDDEDEDEDEEEEEEEQEYEEENLDLLDEVHAMREEQAAER